MILFCASAAAYGQSPAVLAKLYKTIKSNYVDTIDGSAAITRAAAAMAGEVDIYTRYLNRKQYEELTQIKQGRDIGAGIELAIEGSDTVITKVHTLSPAHIAGVRAGQILTNFRAANDTAFFTANGKAYIVPYKKFAITVVDCVQMLTDNIGYIKFDNFRAGAADSLRAAYDKIKAAGAKAVVLDLRDNGGGLVRECIKVASLFLPPNTLVTSTRGRKNEYNYSHHTSPTAGDTTTTLVMLTSPRTGSAAEMLIGALQDYKRAAVVGTQTYGKGVGQRTFKVGKDCYVSLTVIKYFTPNGRTFAYPNGGLKPEIEIANAKYVDIENLNSDKAVQKAIESI